ncbi:NAD(P)H-dependent glycerol-3-phosphate dehydrogenase [Mycoplasma bradburyae]|uniref:Glycerol-3-phosphate dehydrogenase n=1 Tax=Mycoplasma bradburyae TaxID=2963128 RepID=A0ABT5GC17_9MOLU|nr:NAD(P)H-dependent glycerol-3-phosphate dehydrogenase [Mycoplasma bradburyae]MDC4181941.1 NAD(P)-binding domain-containing protein [Mycoplasma bradburyae]UTS70366.1 NAD(P)-binding domain-containing protein [Mycoplasma bradburyae]
MKRKVAILGTGAWGTALANVLLKNNHTVKMWGIDLDEIKDLNNGYNTRYFGHKKLYKAPDLASTDLEEVVSDCDFVLLAIPSKFFGDVLDKLANVLKDRKINLINVAKGIDSNTKQFWSDVIRKLFEKNLLSLTSLLGPSFAIEVFNNHPTVINAVSSDINACKDVCELFNNDTFELIPYQNELSAQLFAAIKNVCAIGTGIIFEQSQSANTRCAFLTKLFNEMDSMYQGLAKDNYNPKDCNQLSGIGDFILTCTNPQSRNFSFGNLIAKYGIKNALSKNNNTVEGYVAAKTMYELIKANNLELKLLTTIYQILYEDLDESILMKKLIN